MLKTPHRRVVGPWGKSICHSRLIPAGARGEGNSRPINVDRQNSATAAAERSRAPAARCDDARPRSNGELFSFRIVARSSADPARRSPHRLCRGGEMRFYLPDGHTALLACANCFEDALSVLESPGVRFNAGRPVVERRAGDSNAGWSVLRRAATRIHAATSVFAADDIHFHARASGIEARAERKLSSATVIEASHTGSQSRSTAIGGGRSRVIRREIGSHAPRESCVLQHVIITAHSDEK
jgi:hypothetical protein